LRWWLELHIAQIEGDGGALSSAERRLDEARQNMEQAIEGLPGPAAIQTLVSAFSPFSLRAGFASSMRRHGA